MVRDSILNVKCATGLGREHTGFDGHRAVGISETLAQSIPILSGELHARGQLFNVLRVRL